MTWIQESLKIDTNWNISFDIYIFPELNFMIFFFDPITLYFYIWVLSFIYFFKHISLYNNGRKFNKIMFFMINAITFEEMLTDIGHVNLNLQMVLVLQINIFELLKLNRLNQCKTLGYSNGIKMWQRNVIVIGSRIVWLYLVLASNFQIFC